MKKAVFVLVLRLCGLQTSIAIDIKTAELVDIQGSQTDIYVAGNTITNSDSIQGDIRSAGNTVILNNQITQDAAIAGNTITLNAKVGDDARIVGNQIIITSSISGDLLVFGNSVLVGKDVSVNGDLMVGGNKVTIQGKITGKSTIYAETVELDGSFAGDLVLYAQHVRIGSGASVSGTLEYTSKAKNPALETIAGSVVYHEDQLRKQRDEKKNYVQEHKKTILSGFIASVISFKFVSLLITSVILRFLFRHWYGRGAEIVRTKLWKSFWIGLAVLVGLPVVGIVLLFTGLLAAFGGFVLALWFFLVLFIEVAFILVATGWFHQTYNNNSSVRKDLACLVILSLLCAFVAGIDAFLGIFAIGALFMVKQDSRNKIMSDYYPPKKPLR